MVRIPESVIWWRGDWEQVGIWRDYWDTFHGQSSVQPLSLPLLMQWKIFSTTLMGPEIQPLPREIVSFQISTEQGYSVLEIWHNLNCIWVHTIVGCIIQSSSSLIVPKCMKVYLANAWPINFTINTRLHFFSMRPSHWCGWNYKTIV